MRVTSSLWVGAFVRRCYGIGATPVVARRGAEEAGAIFIIIDRLAGVADLYGPAPQSAFEEGRPSDRLFQKIVEWPPKTPPKEAPNYKPPTDI